MAVDVKLVSRHGIKNLLRHFCCSHFTRPNGLVGHGLANQLAAGRLLSRQFSGPVTVALADTGRHEIRAQHTGAELVTDEAQILVKRFAQGNHRMFADVVNAHIGGIEQPGHAGGVDDVALPGRVFRCRGQHHGREQAHAMDDAPEINPQHPFPVLHGVFPDQAAGANASVVEDKVRRAKTLEHRLAHGLHLIGIGHIELEGQHLGARSLHLGAGLVECIGLHVDQHQFHPQFCTDPRALQAKARACAGQNGGFAFEIRDHLSTP